MSRFRLYCGISRDGKWLNHTEVEPLQGGVLAMLDSAEKSGAARLMNLMKGSVKTLYTEDGEEYQMKPSDYDDIAVADTWKIGYEAIKLRTGEEYPVIPEAFYCEQCSRPKMEKYTKVNESWQKLIEDGIIDEIFLQNPDITFDVELAEPIVIPAGKTFGGGTYEVLVMKHMSLGDMLRIHRNQEALANEASMIRASWDATIVKIKGMNEADFNRIMKIPGQSFSKKYLTSEANQNAIEKAMDDNVVGLDAWRRVVYCENCGNELRGELDFTNFFSPLLPKKSNRNR